MLLALLTLLADGEAPATPTQGGSPFGQMMPIMLIMLAAFFIFILPMRRQQKQQQSLLAGVKPRDKVLTAGGIIGIVHQIPDKKDDQVKEDEVILRMDDNASIKIRVLKSSIVRVFPADVPATAAPEKK